MYRAIDSIYAAAAAELAWDQAVEQVCRTSCLDACTLSSVDRSDRRPFVLSAYGRDPFFGGTPNILTPNPLLTDRVVEDVPGALWRQHDIMPPDVLRTTSFWRDWMAPNRFVAWSGIILGHRGEQVVCFEAYTRTLCVSPQSIHLLSRLAPHLARAWRVGETIRPLTVPAATGAPARRDEDDAAALMRLRADFGLTKAEARLALALVAGRSPAEAAERFGRKLTTIRSQLQHIFAKTGACRQAELVAILLKHGHFGASAPTGCGTSP